MSQDTLFFPIDTLKTRLQSHAGFWASGGFSGVYKGIASVIVGSAPGGESFQHHLAQAAARADPDIDSVGLLRVVRALKRALADCECSRAAYGISEHGRSGECYRPWQAAVADDGIAGGVHDPSAYRGCQAALTGALELR